MKVLRYTWVVVLMGLSVMAGTAAAQIDPVNSSAVLGPGPAGIMVRPDGAGTTLAGVGALIRVYVQDVTGVPISGLTRRDFEVDAAPATLSLSDGFVPGGPAWDLTPFGFTNLGGGNYRIDGSLLAGGNAAGAMVKARGVILTGAPLLPLRINSPDMNGDAVVNLTDVAFFAAAYFGAYDWRADFNFDGVLNLADIVPLAAAMGATLPAGYVIDPVD